MAFDNLRNYATQISDILSRPFSIKPDSLDEFVDMVNEEGATYVAVMPLSDKSYTSEISFEQRYFTRFQSKTHKKRRIVFDRIHAKRDGMDEWDGESSVPFVEDKDKVVYLDRNLLSASHELESLGERLPGLNIYLTDSKGEVIDRQEKIDRLLKTGLAPFNNSTEAVS